MRRAILLLLLLLPVNLYAQTSVIVRGKVSSANASTSVLTNGGVFTGGWESSRDYTTLTVTVFADKASAAGGLVVQWSSDASNVDVTDTYSVSANTGASWTTVTKGTYYRIVYTNGSTTQTEFRLSAILRQSGAPGYEDDGLTDAQLRSAPVPVSGTVTANVGTGTQPVSGTFWQSTQPISGTVTANVGTGTQPVSGTFWQSTQPVSIATMPSTPVTGTFWQATQPVSGTVSAKAQAGDGTSIGSGGTGTGLTVTCTNCGGSVTPITYVWNTPDAVGGASKLHLDLFNASGSGKIVKILGIYPTVKGDVAVTGVVALRWDLYRTSAVGTGGTAAAYKSATVDVAGGSISPRDTNNANLPAQVTARHLPTGGATIAEWLQRGQCFTEETNQATYICSGQTDFVWMGTMPEQPITLREGQGLLIKQGAVASVNNISFRVVFSLE